MNKKNSRPLLSRRQTLRLLGAAGATALVGWAGDPALKYLPLGRRGAQTKAAALDCILRPQLTEGPYFVDERLNRSDIRTEPATGVARPGIPLFLTFNVTGTGGGNCLPVPGAYVDIWHCDAAGNYSDVGNTQGQKYLRGYQVTDENGVAQFTTVFPGWYSGRAVHIHFKIRQFNGSQETYEFTSQLFFEESIINQVYAQAPYSSRGAPNTSNSRDGIYNSGGSQLLLSLTPSGQGYAATFNIGLAGVTGSTPAPAGPDPVITSAYISGKHLIVTGTNFRAGAVLTMNGEKLKKTVNDESSPTTMLIARKAGKWILPGQTVQLVVTNTDATDSEDYFYTRPLS